MAAETPSRDAGMPVRLSRRAALKAVVAGGTAGVVWSAPRIEGLRLVPHYAAAASEPQNAFLISILVSGSGSSTRAISTSISGRIGTAFVSRTVSSSSSAGTASKAWGVVVTWAPSSGVSCVLPATMPSAGTASAIPNTGVVGGPVLTGGLVSTGFSYFNSSSIAPPDAGGTLNVSFRCV